MLPIVFLVLRFCSFTNADFLVRTITVNNVNYDDFSLLCAEGIPLLMEDHRPRPCQPRPWSNEQKCPIGFWCHEGDDENSFYCCPKSRKVSNLCHLPPATGFGKETMRRFYYDWKTDGCHELHYSGIGGNENSFMTYESCEDACRGTGEPNTKAFGGIAGTNKTKEIVDSKKKPDKEKPNKNLPPTISFTISSTVKPAQIPSSKRTATVHRTTQSSTVPVTTTQTQESESNILISTTRVPETSERTTTTATTTQQTDRPELVGNPCVLPPERGFSGGVARKMWYFDMSTLSCVQFTYQGAGGNFNKFDTSDICMSVCGIGKPSRKSCDLPSSLGDGPFKIPRYYFDSSTQKCELFYYTGEDGNDNRFFKKHKCERLCLGKASKKKEQTKYPEEAVTNAPTRVVVNFVSSETTYPSTRAEELHRYTETTPSPWSIENSPEQLQQTVFPYEELKTREPFLEVEQLPETTPATRKMQSTVTIPATITETATTPPLEPNTFPTLVYVPKEEVMESTSDPYVFPGKPLDELFSKLMTVQIPFVTTGAPTIIEKSHIGPVPDTHIPLGNFPWETTPPGFTMPPGLDPSLSVVYVQSPEQLEAMVKAMTVTPPPHHVHGGLYPTENTGIAPSPEVQPVPPISSLPIYQRQWGVQPPQTVQVGEVRQPQTIRIPPQNQPQQPFPSLPSVIPVSSGNSLPNQQNIPSVPPAIPPVQQTPLPTTASYPQLPNGFPALPKEQVPSSEPQESRVLPPSVEPNVQPPASNGNLPSIPQVIVNEIPTDLLTVNISKVSQPINVRVDVVTDSPILLPNISMSFVAPAPNSPCQLPVVDPDVVIMCESEDVFCPMGSFCQIGLGQSICCPSTGGSPCQQPVERGTGASMLTRWYFNSFSNQCETFAFNGFQGNENNFMTYSDCQRTCNAHNPCESGEPVAPTDPENRCSSGNRCPSDAMCHSSGESSACCAPKKPLPTTPKPMPNNDPCRQPISPGEGRESHHRWAFDQNAGRCVSFIYQGLHGNLNNFLTKSDCQAICGSPPTVPARCLQSGISGDGDQYLARYFYSPEYRQCLHFIYSGHGGNENNFFTQQECLETCVANGIKFSSLANNVVPSSFSFSFMPSPVCPQGAPLQNSSGQVVSCRETRTCPSGHVCTSMGPSQFCCPSPENFCLEPRPALSVCTNGGHPVQQIRFTYDPLSDKCVRFSYSDCSPTVVQSLNSFLTQPQCSRLCCNQGFNLMYRRKMRVLMNDSPIEEKRKRF